MTKEQEKAIYRLNKDIENPLACGDTTAVNIKDLKTVLNMLKEKDKEIETLKRDFKIVDQECSRLERKEAKQERQIDLMVEAINKIQDPQVCKYCDNKINLDNGYCMDARKCKEGIKKYFERKATKMSQKGRRMNNVEKALKLIEDSLNKKCNGLECKVVKNNIDLRLENSKLKKQIDLMAEHLIGKIFFNKNNVEMIFDNKEDVKQYFERKVKKCTEDG